MSLAEKIEHTLLKPEAREADIRLLCDEALRAGVLGVCVNSCRVLLAKKLLAGSGIKIVTVVGFPLGAAATEAKAAEASAAAELGADELDMVLNVGALKDCAYDYVRQDIAGVVKAAEGRPVKVILETCLLSDEEKIKATELAAFAGAQFVKTSTGFGASGATLADVKLLAAEARRLGLGVKASGGIRSLEFALALSEAGADRLGVSAGAKLACEASAMGR